jgi:hypothetical protein
MSVLLPKSALLLTLLAATAAPVLAAAAQSPAERATAYVAVTNERADKIVATLGIANLPAALRVRDVIASQYRALNAIQEKRDARIKAAKGRSGAAKDTVDSAIKAATAEADATIEQLHRDYLAKLSTDLSPEQIDQVKDGMTYGVLPLTFRVYQQMLPNLSAEQRQQIFAWLTEAREHAMDGFTSDEKHAWFGKYKGRINNFLAKAGFDMKQAEKEMMARQKVAPTEK